MRRSAVLVVLLLLFLAAACRQPTGGASDARISVGDGGGAGGGGAEIRFGARKAELPKTDIGKEAPSVTQDDAGRRLAYRTVSGQARLLYIVGEGLFVGPLVPHPADFRAAPSVDHALAPLFEAAGTGTRRAELVREVRREKGESGVVRLLVDAAYIDDPAWEEAKKSLATPTSEASLRDALAVGLELGKSPILLRRAVGVVDLKAPGRAKVVLARAKELADGSQEPRAVAVLLRSVMGDKDRASAVPIACEVLAKTPAQGTSRQHLERGSERTSLIEAALLTLAVTHSTCDSNNNNNTIESVLIAEQCMPYVRCNDAGPLSWSDSSNQDEPLCTKEQLDAAINREADRAPREILDNTATRPELFAYAVLLGTNKDRSLPPTFLAAHARRRYAIAPQTAAELPACDSGLTPGTACRCDEPALRSAACRHPEGSPVENGFCHFEIDDKQKKILNVVAGRGTP